MGAEKPMFNAYVNILSSPPSKHNAEGDNKAIFTPYQLSEEEAAGLYTGAAAANPDEAVSSTETGNGTPLHGKDRRGCTRDRVSGGTQFLPRYREAGSRRLR
ncbi:hypothetical protein XPA_001692 [Xanthoria parietina]